MIEPTCMQTETRMTVSVEEAARLLGIGRSLAYEMVREGKIPSLRFGRRVVVPLKALEDLLRSTTATVGNKTP